MFFNKFNVSQIIERLKQKFGDLYTEENVMISGTHTHSSPGGFMMDVLFDLTIFGFVKQTFLALVNGITNVSFSYSKIHFFSSKINFFPSKINFLLPK